MNSVAKARRMAVNSAAVKNPCLLLSLLLLLPLAAAPTPADELLSAFGAKAAKGENVDAQMAAVANLSAVDLKRLSAQIEKIWPSQRDGYLSQLTLTSKTLGGKKGDTRQIIRKHRDDFRGVYAKSDDAMKPLLASVSMPAVEALRKLLEPNPAQLIEAGGEKLQAQRKLVMALAKFRDAAHNAVLFVVPLDSVGPLEAAEKAAAETISGFERNDLKILALNRKTAKDKQVPAAEVTGIEECNELRMLVGLNALLLDPKLCAAARDHSTDMAEKGFFAHESPVPGKKTPWDRAKNFGTSASGENIYMGSADPHAANMGWFYSPGHHKNMFSPGQRRIGMGCSGNHWTQMFGG